MIWHQNEFWCQTNATEFWCHSISRAKLSFADVTSLFEFGTKSLAPPLPVLLRLCAVQDTKQPKMSHLHAVYTEFLDTKQGGCQFLGCRLISWQCKKQTVVANSTTEAEYVAALSCYGQFWATVKAKTINGKVQLQALVDGKKIIITGAPITTSWNEFSSTMTSAIIYLAINQKFNFSKYIFESMVKNLDNAGKFFMYPRFVQVFVNQQLEGMPAHKRIYIAPSHTKKIFGNMRRLGKGFYGRETPLFQTMVVQDQAEMGEGSAIHTDPHHTPTFIQPSTSQPQMKQRSRRPKRKDTQVPQSSVPSDNIADEAVNEEMDDSLVRAATTATSLDAKQNRGNINKTQSKATLNEPSSSGTSSGSGPRGNTLQSGEDRLKLEELMALCTTLQSRVLALETTKTTQATEIVSLKRRFKKLERRNKSRTHGLKRLYRVGSSRRVESSENEGLGKEDASKQGRIADIDANEDIYLVNVRTDEDMFGVNDLNGDEVIVESVDFVKTAKETRSVVEEVTGVTIPVIAATTTTTTTAITDVEMTLAQALAELKSLKPKATTITTTPTLTTTTAAITITAVSIRPRAKGLVIHEEQAPTPTVSS
ncbi:hypothetical protein Tco_0451256 [Tanacetum coccineum]